MRKIILSSFLALFPLAVLAQEEITFNHDYAAFDGISLTDYVDATIVPSNDYSVNITCDERIEEFIIAYVKEGVLNISIDMKSMPPDTKKLFRSGTGGSGDKEWNSSAIHAPKVEILMPKLRNLTIDGSSSVSSSGAIVSDKVSFILKKTASVSGLSLKADSMYLELSQKASADMSADVAALNVQAGNSATVQMKVPSADSVIVNAGSFSYVEIYGAASTVSLESEGSAKIKFSTPSL